MKLHLLLPLLLAFFMACTPSNPNIVSVEGGQIEGTTNQDASIRIFKGIPFAAPPVDDLRWKAPQPVVAWEGIKKCDQFGPSPMQGKPSPFMFWSSEFLIPAEPISEDCLYLNVWTTAKNKAEKQPVFVYIYGGGFRSGGTGCPIYDGEAMAKKGVIFVSINYRVGTFGFLAHPELTAEAGYDASGNYALLDLKKGLEWVQNNIAAFGGDPGNVTIAGQSAGAFAVNYLAASPQTKGLFHRAIAQSGGSFYSRPGRPVMDLQVAEQQGIDFAKNLGVNSIAELRQKSAEEILEAQGGTSWPIIDGYFINQSIYDIYAEGKQNDVPIIVGWNEDDKLSARPVSAAEFQTRAEERFGDLTDELFEVYPNDDDEISANSQGEMGRDETFGIQGYTWAKIQTETGSKPAYIYNFNSDLPAHTPETQFGAFHSGEIVYAYDNLHTLDRPWEPVDQEIADIMSAYWVNFAKNGNPNGNGLPQWDAYQPDNEEVMIIDQQTESKTLPSKDQFLFWEKYFESK